MARNISVKQYNRTSAAGRYIHVGALLLDLSDLYRSNRKDEFYKRIVSYSYIYNQMTRFERLQFAHSILRYNKAIDDNVGAEALSGIIMTDKQNFLTGHARELLNQIRLNPSPYSQGFFETDQMFLGNISGVRTSFLRSSAFFEAVADTDYQEDMLNRGKGNDDEYQIDNERRQLQSQIADASRQILMRQIATSSSGTGAALSNSAAVTIGLTVVGGALVFGAGLPLAAAATGLTLTVGQATTLSAIGAGVGIGMGVLQTYVADISNQRELKEMRERIERLEKTVADMAGERKEGDSGEKEANRKNSGSSSEEVTPAAQQPEKDNSDEKESKKKKETQQAPEPAQPQEPKKPKDDDGTGMHANDGGAHPIDPLAIDLDPTDGIDPLAYLPRDHITLTDQTSQPSMYERSLSFNILATERIELDLLVRDQSEIVRDFANSGAAISEVSEYQQINLDDFTRDVDLSKVDLEKITRRYGF